jgi:hypothetical protein
MSPGVSSPRAAAEVWLDAGRPQAGAALPVVCTRCMSLIAAEGLTAKRRAAARIDLPRSTVRTIRKSEAIGAGMATFRLVSTDIVESRVSILRSRNVP